jgi:hypothetical protein
MLLPQLRRNLKNTNSHNKSLQDIAKSCSKATEVLSVEPYNGKVHNTKITLQIDKGSNVPEQERYEKRIQFYNRLDIAEILENVEFGSNNTLDLIEELNSLGFDFTEDDIIYSSGQVLALDQSLGYYNRDAEECMPTELRWIPSANNLNNLNTDRSVLSFILEIDGEEVQKDRIFFEANASAEKIVTELFLYSGFDLMRQLYMRDYFTYSPRLDFQDILNPGTEIRITGYGAGTQPEENYAFERHSINLKLVPMNAFSLEDEPSDKSTWFDYVQQQFGGARTIHSCGTMYNTGE